MYSLSFILPILPLTLALPAAPTTEQWHIPRLDMHMMSPTTGLPSGGPWPPGSQFNSTIDFDVLLPSPATCHATFPNATLPPLTSCTPSTLAFEMSALDARRPELAFRLQLIGEGGEGEMWRGEQDITANNPQEETSYLTCLGGAPMDGFRCGLGGGMSVRRELSVEVVRIVR